MNARQLAERANALYRALNGSETDETTITTIITSHTKRELQSIKAFYYSIYKRFIEDDLKKQAARGHFLGTVLALLQPTSEIEAKHLEKAIQGHETNITAVIQILCTKDSYEIQAIRNSYKKLFGRYPERDIAEKEGGALGRLFRTLLQLVRSGSTIVDKYLARREAEELYEAGKGKVVIEEMEFVRILSTRSFTQLKATFQEYYSLYKEDIENSIKSVIHEPLKSALTTIVRCTVDKPKYFAEEINSCVRKFIPKDDYLLRLITSRYEIDLSEIKAIYEDMYGQKLEDTVKSYVTGNYGKILITLLNKS